MTPTLIFKSIFSSCSHLTGLLNYLSLQKMRDCAFILTYHRVLESPFDGPLFIQPGMRVIVDTFSAHVAFLKERFNVISLSELVGRVFDGKSIKGCCAITFDDGWHDNFTHAFPILQEFHVPATVFLATSFIGTNRMFWPEEFTYYLRQPEVRNSLPKSSILTQFLSEVGSPVTDVDFLDTAVGSLKRWPSKKREELLQELRSIAFILPPRRLLMSWNEIEEMHSSGLISFGAHTASHVILDQIPIDQAVEEIVRSRNEIEHHIGVSPELFAYPNGNYTAELQAILQRNGFKGAVTTRKGWIGQDSGLFEIPRIGIHEDVSSTIPLFFARILFDGF